MWSTVGCPCFKIIGKFLVDKVTDQLHLNSLKPACVSLLKFLPRDISAANSLVWWFQHRTLSEDISAEKKNVELRWGEAYEGDCFLVSALTGLGVF